MACPYFYPEAKTDNSAFAIPPRLPLGDAHTGQCRAQAVPFSAEEPALGRMCNTGYGRGSCERFPSDAPVDAVRFNIAQEGSTIRIQYVLEKDCWPAGHGILEYLEADARFVEAHRNPILQRQAEAFVGSFLRRVNMA